MRKRVLAFWDVVFCSIASALLIAAALFIIVFVKGDTPWYSVPIHYVIIAATCIAVSVTLVLCMQRVVIDINCNKTEWFYLINHRINSKDLLSNWVIYPSEIEKVTVVRLSKEEKRKYTSARFLFSKYLKVEMKYGHTKYVYVSHYSSFQIKQIIHMLTSSKNKRV